MFSNNLLSFEDLTFGKEMVRIFYTFYLFGSLIIIYLSIKKKTCPRAYEQFCDKRLRA